MSQGKSKVALPQQNRGMNTDNINREQGPGLAEPETLRAAMNTRGAGILGALGLQMNAHLNSLAVLEGDSNSLIVQCRIMVLEIGKLLEAVEQYQASHADVLTHASLLRRLVAEFAQHVHNSQLLATTT